jgi:hypothetical protein
MDDHSCTANAVRTDTPGVTFDKQGAYVSFKCMICETELEAQYDYNEMVEI